MPRSLKHPHAAPIVPAAPSLAFAIHVVERLTPRDRWVLRMHMARLLVWAPARKTPEPPRTSRRDDDLGALKWKAKR
ncbi:MAG TPA: hypothetical protein VHP33_33620 [Polyangiaceae bacterium]|nr:hypothetical protein [Polyangiaceae bacterium]